MVPTSNKPIDKVTFGAIAAAIATIVLALIKRFVWVDMPADLEGPFNTVIAALVIGFASGAAGWLTPIKPGEITAVDVQHIESSRP